MGWCSESARCAYSLACEERPTSSTVKRMAAARAGNEQISMRAAGSEAGRRRARRKATPANQVHAVRTVLRERSNCWRISLLGIKFVIFSANTVF